MASETELLRLALLAYEAATEPALWSRFLELFNDAVSSDSSLLQVHDLGLDKSTILQTFGASSRLKPSYNEHYSKMNVWRQRGRALYVRGAVNLDQEQCPRPAFERSEFYNDFLRRVNLAHSMGVVINRFQNRAPTLTALRGQRKGEYGEKERKVARFLIPHLGRAWSIHERLDLLSAGESVMDALPLGVVFLAADSSAIYSNRAAEEMFRANDGLRMREGRLSAIDPKANVQLRKAIRSALAPGQAVAGPAVVSVPRSGPRREYQVVAAPLRARFQQFVGAPMPHVAALITDPERKEPTSSQLLVQFFKLTPKEALMSAKLSEGKSVRQAAEELSITYETARTHLRRIFSKTGTSRQVDLLLLLHQLRLARGNRNA